MYAIRSRLYVRLSADNGLLDVTLEFFSLKGMALLLLFDATLPSILLLYGNEVIVL